MHEDGLVERVEDLELGAGLLTQRDGADPVRGVPLELHRVDADASRVAHFHHEGGVFGTKQGCAPVSRHVKLAER